MHLLYCGYRNLVRGDCEQNMPPPLTGWRILLIDMGANGNVSLIVFPSTGDHAEIGSLKVNDELSQSFSTSINFNVKGVGGLSS